MSETSQGAFNDASSKQFLRYCELTFKDFNKGTKTVIGDEFEIEFDYFKTIDQTVEDDSGSIKIYGLKDETIKLLQAEGGEVWLKCGYVGSYIDILFIAYISRVYTERKNNISITTVECSANLMTHFFSGYAISDIETTLPLFGLLTNLGKSLGFPATEFDMSNVPNKNRKDVSIFLNSYKTNSYNIGDLNTIVEYVCDYFGLQYQRALVNDTDTALFSFTDLGLKKTLKKIESGYNGLNIDDQQTQALSEMLVNTIEADTSLPMGVVLTKTSGLIESQDEYQIITSFADQKLNANEVETEESIYKRNNPAPEKKPSMNFDSTVSLNSGDGFVSNSTLSGLKIKSSESTSGGSVRGYTADFAAIVQNMLGTNLRYFSSFNDLYHANRGGRHPAGQAFDLVLRNPSTSASVSNQIRAAAERSGYRVKLLDEYLYPSEGSTGGHIHVSVYGRTDSGATPPTAALNQDDFTKSEEDFYGRVPIEINRRYNKITALLNPVVKPQSLVFTEDSDGENYLVHRVRHATYKGNNKRGDWTMVLYCEDTENKKIDKNSVNQPAIS